MSLQSRLDIICDDAEGGSGSSLDDGKEATDETSTEKPVAQRVLQLLRSVTYNIDIFEPLNILQFCLMRKLCQENMYIIDLRL